MERLKSTLSFFENNSSHFNHSESLSNSEINFLQLSCASSSWWANVVYIHEYLGHFHQKIEFRYKTAKIKSLDHYNKHTSYLHSIFWRKNVKLSVLWNISVDGRIGGVGSIFEILLIQIILAQTRCILSYVMQCVVSLVICISIRWFQIWKGERRNEIR